MLGLPCKGIANAPRINCVPHQLKRIFLAHYDDDALIPLIGVLFIPSNQTRAA